MLRSDFTDDYSLVQQEQKYTFNNPNDQHTWYQNPPLNILSQFNPPAIPIHSICVTLLSLSWLSKRPVTRISSPNILWVSCLPHPLFPYLHHSTGLRILCDLYTEYLLSRSLIYSIRLHKTILGIIKQNFLQLISSLLEFSSQLTAHKQIDNYEYNWVVIQHLGFNPALCSISVLYSQTSLSRVCNRDAICFLRGTNSFIYTYLNKLRSLKVKTPS